MSSLATGLAVFAIIISIVGTVIGMASPVGTSPSNAVDAPQCLASTNFIVSTSMFECMQGGVDYGLFMYNWPCGKLAVEWFSAGAAGFTNNNFAQSTNSYTSYIVGAVNSTGILAIALGTTSCSPIAGTGAGCVSFFKFSTKTWGSDDCSFTGVAPTYPARGYNIQMLNSTSYIVTVIGSDQCIYSMIMKGSTAGGFAATGLCGNTTFNFPAINFVTEQLLSSPTGFSISLTITLAPITGTVIPVDVSQLLNMNIYATYANPTTTTTFQLQGSNNGGGVWSNLGNPCTFASSATAVFASCGYQAIPNAFSSGEILIRIEADGGLASTLTLYDLGIEFHT